MHVVARLELGGIHLRVHSMSSFAVNITTVSVCGSVIDVGNEASAPTSCLCVQHNHSNNHVSIKLSQLLVSSVFQ